MLSSPFPFFSGGNTELTASMLNLMLEQMRRQGRLVPAYPILVNQSGEGWTIRLAGVRGFWAIAGRHEGNGRYGWAEAQLTPAGWMPRAGGRSGGSTLAASEANGRQDVSVGEVLFLVTDGSAPPTFVAPIPPSLAPQLMWARIDGSGGGGYGWTEMTYLRGQFVVLTGGQTAGVGSPDSAVEVNGLTVPTGSIVVLYRSPGVERGCVFEYGGSDPGFWAVLLRERKGSEYEIDLAGATGGTWTVTFDPGEDAPPGTEAGSVTLAFDATAAEAEDALEGLTGGDVSVTGSYTFVMAGNLVGESGASLSFDGGGLEPAEPTGDDEPAEFSATQTVVGRDLPYADGRGAYAWVRAEFDDFGRLRPADAGEGSTWPTNLALEANADRTVPEGSVVWVTPRPPGYMLRAVADDADEFAEWTTEELDAHLADVDFGDGWLSDDGVDFHWQGADSFWAELTDEPDADGLYPFRVVHMGGRDEPDAPAALPAAVTAETLRAERLAGAHGTIDTFETPLAASDAAWVPSRPGGREITGVAREILSRTGFAIGTVVRVYATPVGTMAGGSAAPAAEGVEFTFAGPPLSMWATLGAETGTPGTYEWTELRPAGDAAARTGEAREVSARTGIPADTAVYLTPEWDGRMVFTHRAHPAEGGRDCRLLHWTGGSTATIVAGPDDPDSDGLAVSVQFFPPHATELVKHGYLVGYRAPGASYYAIPQPFDYAGDRLAGCFTTGGQWVSGGFAIGRLVGGSLTVTGGGESPPFPHPESYRYNPVAGTAETYTPGFGIVKNDGSLRLSGGPYLIADGGSLDLRGGAAWSVTNTNLTSNSGTSLLTGRSLDGVTGTYVIPGAAGASDGSITFKSGLYLGSVQPGARPSTYTGSFMMKDLGFGGDRTVTVVEGVVSNIQ